MPRRPEQTPLDVVAAAAWIDRAQLERIWAGDADRPTLVAFQAEWSPPSRLMDPVLDELAVEFAGRADIVRVDVDGTRGIALADRFGITLVPSFVVVTPRSHDGADAGTDPEPAADGGDSAAAPSPSSIEFRTDAHRAPVIPGAWPKTELHALLERALAE